MDFVILFFLISWKYEHDMEKYRLRVQQEEREFEQWLLSHPYAPGDGAAIAAAASVAAACCI